ncbi:hypothetical protein HPB48_022398 [Haemaphysalis longicornis]|uniref:Uncharacterized protein n=1 Tax=Haemaphysalis longicornis TaxID=44386 RepID=A0A9J6FYX7_HAELO|nr:hypothetical protein HPB48_022398 [Haemaphysalis longicornis]
MELLKASPLTRGLVASESFDSHDDFGHGIFQKKTMLLLIISVFVLNSQARVIKLIAGDVDHWCRPPPNYNLSATTWRKVFIPVEADGKPNRCLFYKYHPDFNPTERTACQEWEYDASSAGRTVISYWNLVCHRRVLLVAALPAQNSAGVLCIAAGPIADYVGRAPVIRVAAVLLVICTVANCFVISCAIYVTVRFFTACFANVNVLCALILFEITTHDNRPLHIFIAGAIGLLIADVLFPIITLIHLNWVLKQVLYLSPAFLSLSTYFVVQESPRWLISQGKYNTAENVMLEGTRLNGFPLPNTACLLKRLREQERDINQDCLSDQKKALDDCPLIRRELIMILSFFSLILPFHVSIFSGTSGSPTFFRLVSFPATFMAYTAMHHFIVRVPLVKILWLCYLLLSVIQSLLALAVHLQPKIITEILLILSKAGVYVTLVTSIAYIMELVPTRVRASAVLVVFGCGRAGSVCAFVFYVLQKIGRKDSAFFLAALLLFLALLALQFLPQATEVECAKIYTRRESALRRQGMHHTKKMLEPSKPAESSRESEKSTPRPRLISARHTPQT